ncbi:Mak10-domain-containing protein [Backusella circina FSU 941]|nr:Mak10-domain-containing protein [Backusella circina FSU 941]
MQQMKDLEEAYSELNINVPEQQNYLLPKWKDITQFLDEATNDFDVGQLVHLPSFTLYDAMSAIEIMDPRMDTGMTIEENTFDIKKHLSTRESLWIMDRLLTCEMAWISGHSLSQTVYTCTYFHHVKVLNETPMPTLSSKANEIIYGVLKTYVLATVKSCHYIWTEMTQGNVYEEEDFTTNLFGLSFDDQNPDIVILNDLDTSIMLLNHLLNTTSEDKEMVQAFLDRLQIRKCYLMSLIYFSQKEGSHLSQAKADLNRIMAYAKTYKETIPWGEKVEGAFDPNISRKLTSQTPPRHVELLSEERSFDEFMLLVSRLSSICDVMDFPSVTSLMNFFIHFGSTTPYPDAFSRSKLNTLLFHNQRIFGTLQVSSVILLSIEETVRPPAWWLNMNHRSIPSNVDKKDLQSARDALHRFLERISMVFLECFRIQCHNRSRQRRMLCKVVGEWEVLQEEAAAIDEIFHELQPHGEEVPFYFSSWAYNIKLNMIETLLFLGFELELYGQHEHIMIYWYIQCVLGSHAFLLDRIAGFIDHTTYPKEKVESSFRFIQSNQYLNYAKKYLTAAILKILLTAQHTHQWVLRPPVYDDENTRYTHRFKSFMNLASPPHPTFEVYMETVHVVDLDPVVMVDIIKKDLLEAKKMTEVVLKMKPEDTKQEMCFTRFTEDLKNMIRTIVANNIGLNYIGNSDIGLKQVFEYQPWWPKITKK